MGSHSEPGSRPHGKGAVLKRLEISAIVSKEASIADVLQLLAKDGLVFTVDEGGIHGFVTPSDLERHAARSHFYLLIAGIEMLLAQIVRERVGSSSIVARLHGDSQERWEADLAGDHETDPSEYLYLRDLGELFMELSESELCWDSIAHDLDGGLSISPDRDASKPITVEGAQRRSAGLHRPRC